MKRILPNIVLVLAIIGLVDSIYLSLAHFGLVNMHSSSLPSVCHIGAGGCEDVLQSSLGVIYGVPTALLGVMYFTVVALAAAYRLSEGRWPFPSLLSVFMIGGLAFSIYLLNTLFFKLSSPCPYCVMAHTANVIAFVGTALSFQKDDLITSATRAFNNYTRYHAPRRWRTHP